MSMTQTQSTGRSIAEGDRIYATETILISDGYDGADVILPGSEGEVAELTGDDDYDLLIEWDRGFQGVVNSGSVALLD